MDKLQLLEVLESCLLTFEGADMNLVYDSKEPKNVRIGINLCRYLEGKL